VARPPPRRPRRRWPRLSSDAWDPARRRQPDFSGFPLAFVRVEGNERVDSRAILGPGGLAGGGALPDPSRAPGAPARVRDVRLPVGALRPSIRRTTRRCRLPREGEAVGTHLPPLRPRDRGRPGGRRRLRGEGQPDPHQPEPGAVGSGATTSRWALIRVGGPSCSSPWTFAGHFFLAPWAVTIRSRATDLRGGQPDRLVHRGREPRPARRRASSTDAGGRCAWASTAAASMPRWTPGRRRSPPSTWTEGASPSTSASTIWTGPPSPGTAPRRGLHSIFSRTSLGAEESYDRVELVASHFRGRGRPHRLRRAAVRHQPGERAARVRRLRPGRPSSPLAATRRASCGARCWRG
jgi:hypothetical protein